MKPGGGKKRAGGGNAAKERSSKHTKKHKLKRSTGKGKKSKGRGRGSNLGKGSASRRDETEANHEAASATGGGSKADFKRGMKRKFGKASAKDGDAKDKGKKLLTIKQKSRKEVTKIYAELINPGRTKKADSLVSEILKLLGTRSSSIADYCATQVGSHVIQACLKWGTKEQRLQLLSSLKEQIPKLACDRYAHQVVLKLLRYVTKTATERKPTDEERKARGKNLREFLEGFHGKLLHTAFYHRHGCRVINGIYFSEAVGLKEKRRLLHEVAVSQAVALTRSELPGSRALRQLLGAEDMTEEQRKSMMSHLREVIEKVVDKELLIFDIVHLLFQAFCEKATEEQLRDLGNKCMAGAAYLLSSKPGTEALVHLLGVASAKERKALLRDLKGKFVPLATNAVDYIVMIRLAMTVDDTVLLVKTMLAEWMADLKTLCFDKYGHKVLAWLFRPDDSHIFDPHERELLALPSPTSLKASATRRQELLRALRPPVRAMLVEQPLEIAADVHAKGLLIAYLAADWDTDVVEALLNAGEREAASNGELGLLGNGTTTTTLLVLLRLEPAEADTGLALPLWRRCLELRLAKAAISRCAFVILALLKGNGKVREAVLSTLRQKRGELEKAVRDAEASGTEVKGAKLLLDEAKKKV